MPARSFARDDGPSSATAAERCAALIAALCAKTADPGPPLPDVMVIVAHPDDETVGAGSRLPRLRDARFVYVTDGAPRDGRDAASHGLSPAGYAELRRRELAAALALCGISPDQVLNLGCPDQQATAHMAALARRLLGLFAQVRPEAVLTHPYEGGHPDHDAVAFAVHAAAAMLRRRGPWAPGIVEMASYHAGAGGIRPCAFLPDGLGEVATIELAPSEQRHKRALVECFATQRQTLAYFPIDTERFRPSPAYDFLRPPHEGRLFYESHAWGTTGSQFRRLAAQAMAELALEGRL